MQKSSLNVINAADSCFCLKEAHGSANLSTSEASQDLSVKKLKSVFTQPTQFAEVQQHLLRGQTPGGDTITTILNTLKLSF